MRSNTTNDAWESNGASCHRSAVSSTPQRRMAETIDAALGRIVDERIAGAQVSMERNRSPPQERPPQSKTRRGCPAGHSPQVSHRPNRHSGCFAGKGF